MGASTLQPALKIIQKIFIYSILNKITTMKNPKYIKLFEEWCPNLGYNESEKEQLKTDYEKYVMSRNIIFRHYILFIVCFQLFFLGFIIT